MPIPVAPGQLDGLLAAFPGAEFRLGRAAYGTRGAWAFRGPGRDWVMASGGAQIVGAGAGQTVLTLQNPEVMVGTSQATYWHLLTVGAREGSALGSIVRDLTLDCPKLPTKALQIWGAASIVEGVVVDNLWGERGVLEGEGFGILLSPSPEGTTDGDHLVKNCCVHVQPGAYACAVYNGTEVRPNRRHEWSLLEDIVAVCPSTPETRAHCGFGLNSRTALHRCQAHGFERAIFSDTGSGEDVLVKEFTASGCSIGVEFRSSRREWYRRNIRFEDATFIFGGGRGDYVAGVVLADDSPAAGPVMEQIRFHRCRFINASGKTGHVGSSNGQAFAPVEFTDCEWIGHWDTEQATSARWRLDGRFLPGS